MRKQHHKNGIPVQIPRNWSVSKLAELFSVQTGTTPSTKEDSYWTDGTVNWVTPTDLSKLSVSRRIDASERKITEKAVRETSLSVMPRGSIVISTRAPVGYVALVDEPCTFNQGCKGLIPKNNTEASSEFYSHYLLSRKRTLLRLSGGSTFAELSKERLESLELLVPPFPEQQRIAEMLSTVDRGIERVNETIEKTRRLKTGLIRRLLTRGIGHKESKETEIGRIPREWQVVALGDVSLDLAGGGTPLTSRKDYWNGDIAWMTSAHINGRQITTGQRYITKEAVKNSATNIVPKGNLLVATRVGIGKAAVNMIDVAISQDLTGVVIDVGKAVPDFVYWVLISNERRLRSLSQGSTIKGILREELAKLKLPLPPLSEQRKITEILGVVDSSLEKQAHKRQRLERVKAGLMNDLLTGRRRVKLTH